MDESSPFYTTKQMQLKIYMDIFGDFIDSIVDSPPILDAGCGVGRFSVELARRGFFVYILDISEKSLKVATKHLMERGFDNFVVYLADVEDMDFFEDEKFEASFAIELLPYVSNPLKAMSELVRVTKKGGLMFLSVEGMYGSIMSDFNIISNELVEVYKTKHKSYTHYYTEETFEDMLSKFEVEILVLEPCHFIWDGIFQRFSDEVTLDKAMEIELMCRKDKLLRNFGRAITAVLRKI
jgi:ubiquinone/menaquinone biosynthesis C-methylase UbiE